MTLFTEMSESVSMMVLDLIFGLGSGFMRGTTHEPTKTLFGHIENGERIDTEPLCRTQQLLLCVALAITRQVIYSFRLKN